MYHPIQPSEDAQATALVIAYTLAYQAVGVPADETALRNVTRLIAETAQELLRANSTSSRRTNKRRS